MNAIVEAINAAGRAFVGFALPMLVQTSLLVVILLLVDLVLRRRVRAVLRYWIWMLVLVKLVLPPSLWSPVSIGTWFGDTLTTSTVALLEPDEPEPAPMRAAQPPSTKRSILSQPGPFAAVPPASTSDSRNTAVESPSPPTVVSPAERAAVRDTHPARLDVGSTAGSQTLPLNWRGLVFLGWAAVASTLLLLLLQRAFFVRGLVVQSQEADPVVQEALEECRRRIGLRSRPAIKVSPNASSPAVCGLIRPTILIPQSLTPKLDGSDLRAILLHELAHIKRGDLWINLVQTLLQVVYFYNPLLWLANAMIRRTREQAVDEAVLVAMGDAAQQYPETLVNIARLAFTRRPALSLRLIGVVESKSALAGRIKHMLSRPLPRTARLGLLGLTVIVLIAAVLLPMAEGQGQDVLSRLAILPDNVTVELVGVCEYPSEGRQWWGPDGETLREVPCTRNPRDKVGFVASDERVYEMAFRFGRTDGLDLQWHAEGTPGHMVGVPHDPSTGATLSQMRLFVAHFPKTQRTAQIQIDIRSEGGPAQSIRFAEVSLRPGRRTDVRISVESRDTDRGAGGGAPVGSGETVPREAVKHNMLQLGLGIALYANEHDGELPTTLAPLEPYVGDARAFAWLRENAVYVAKGNVKDYAKPYSIVTAYEAAQKVLPPIDDRYVLFLDGHVELAGPQRLNEVNLEDMRQSLPQMSPAAIEQGSSEQSGDVLKRLIDEVQAGGTVVIPKGRYTEPIEVGKAVVLRGESREECVFEVTADRPAVLIDTKGQGQVTVENVTIRWQRATSGRTERPFALMVKDSTAAVRNCRFEPLGNYQRSPVAVRIDGFSKATVDNCRFNGFEYTVCYGPGTEGVVQDCIITNSGHQGVINYEGATLTVQRCIITGSKYHAVRCTGGTLNVKDNLLIHNANRGIYLGNKSGRGSIVNNLILGNGTGISGFAQATYVIANNVLVSNEYAGIDMRDSCRLDIHNNILAKNPRGVMLHKEGTRNYNTLGENVYWNNGTDIENFDKPSDPIKADPQFSDPNSGDFSVQGPANARGHGLTDPQIIKNLWRKYEQLQREQPAKPAQQAGPVTTPAPAQPPAVLAWQRTDRYVPPDANGFFPDDPEAGKRLDALFKAGDRDGRPDEEILSTVRRGFRRMTTSRNSMLQWVGRRFIWGKDPQNPEAIELMYHAIPLERYYAVYSGLSVVKDKSPNLLRTLAGICMQGEQVGRITWGLGDQREQIVPYITPHLQDADPQKREVAEMLVKHFKGELDFEKWQQARRVEQVKTEFAGQLPQLKRALLTGDSQARRGAFTTVTRNGLAAILDDSFLPAVRAAATDSDPSVRNEAARLLGGRWVWRAEDQNPNAIESLLMLSSDDNREVRYSAVYFGLSTVRDKSEPVVRRLIEMALADHESNLYGRIIWGLQASVQDSSEPFVRILSEHLDRAGSDLHHAAAVYALHQDILKSEPPEEWKLSRIKERYPDDLFAVPFFAKGSFHPQDADALWDEFAKSLPQGVTAERLLLPGPRRDIRCIAKVRGKAQVEAVTNLLENHPRLSMNDIFPLSLSLQLYLEEMSAPAVLRTDSPSMPAQVTSGTSSPSPASEVTPARPQAPGPIQQRIDAAAPGATFASSATMP